MRLTTQKMVNFNRGVLFLVTALCVLDCLTTLAGYIGGAAEANPLMALLLNAGILAFISFKLGATGTIYLFFSFTRKVVGEMEQIKPRRPQTKLVKYMWTGTLYGFATLMMFVLVNNVQVLIA